MAIVPQEAQTAPATQPESLDAAGALEYLNSNGYTISQGQLYKETSNGTIPFHKFGNKLHFKTSELKAWAENRLVSDNSVGYLPPPTFSSRIPRVDAKNIPNEPKGSTPWRTPVPMRAEPSLLRLCRVQPGEDRRSTPEQFHAKLCTPIVPQPAPRRL